ncbi:hypothetical protein, partial [Actinotalea sp.]|uniref:hypothetical protein n=1 Tax=Actinotalea sp. TaxID=1872145 RepID=UPI002C41CBDF
THLRFFTRESLLAMLGSAGLAVVDLRTTVLDPLGSEVAVDAAALPPGVVEWVREQPDAMSYQFVVRAVRDDAEGAALAATRERDELRQRVRDLEARAGMAVAERDAAVAGLATLEQTVTLRVLRPVRRGWGALRRRLGSGR